MERVAGKIAARTFNCSALQLHLTFDEKNQRRLHIEHLAIFIILHIFIICCFSFC